jgi:hypothetical protein
MKKMKETKTKEKKKKKMVEIMMEGEADIKRWQKVTTT